MNIVSLISGIVQGVVSPVTNVIGQENNNYTIRETEARNNRSRTSMIKAIVLLLVVVGVIIVFIGISKKA